MTTVIHFAFNIWDIDSARAVMDAAIECQRPVILQTSSRVFEGMDPAPLRLFISDYIKKAGINVYLHLDHCRKLDVIREAVDAGWDSVMLDASHLPLEENIRLTNEICAYTHKRGILVEAEVGPIPGSEDDIENPENSTADLEDIRRFLSQTDIDLFAAAVGTCHGLYREPPHIRHDLIEEIQRISDKPLVIHGGSGLTDKEIKKLISHRNVKKINISTDLKQAYREALLDAYSSGILECHGFDVATVKKGIYTSLKQTVMHKLQLLERDVRNE